MSVVVRATRVATLLGVALASSLPAQELTLLDARVRRQIAQEISGDASYEHIRFMTQFHRPGGGANGLWTVAEYYERKAKEFGLDDVRLIRQRDTDRPWNAKFADLWIVEPEPTRLASTIQSPLHLADNSRATDVTAEIVDIGAGDSTGYAGRDVKGKIVLTYGPLGGVMREAVLNRGALGVIWYPSPFSGPVGIVGAGPGMPDQVRWISIPSGTVDGKEPTFAFGLSLRQGIELRNRLAAGRRAVAGDGRGVDPRHRYHVGAGHRAHRAPPGGASLRQRRRQRLRQRAGDRPRAESPHRRGPHAAPATHHPVLVGNRDLEPASVLRRPPGRASAHLGQRQPGHGWRQPGAGRDAQAERDEGARHPFPFPQRRDRGGGGAPGAHQHVRAGPGGRRHPDVPRAGHGALRQPAPLQRRGDLVPPQHRPHAVPRGADRDTGHHVHQHAGSLHPLVG